MKVVVVTALGGPEVLRVQEWTKPEPKAGEVLIRVEATSVNFADIKARQGRYHGASQPPFIPGLDAAGTVEAVGPKVKGVSLGDRVMAFPSGGSYAEYRRSRVVGLPHPGFHCLGDGGRFADRGVHRL